MSGLDSSPLRFSKAYSLTGYATVNDQLLHEMNQRAKAHLAEFSSPKRPSQHKAASLKPQGSPRRSAAARMAAAGRQRSKTGITLASHDPHSSLKPKSKSSSDGLEDTLGRLSLGKPDFEPDQSMTAPGSPKRGGHGGESPSKRRRHAFGGERMWTPGVQGRFEPPAKTDFSRTPREIRSVNAVIGTAALPRDSRRSTSSQTAETSDPFGTKRSVRRSTVIKAADEPDDTPSLRKEQFSSATPRHQETDVNRRSLRAAASTAINDTNTSSSKTLRTTASSETSAPPVVVKYAGESKNTLKEGKLSPVACNKIKRPAERLKKAPILHDAKENNVELPSYARPTQSALRRAQSAHALAMAVTAASPTGSSRDSGRKNHRP